jgi:hypothetical protein
MKLFECQHCGQLLYFENTRCESCERRLGYLPSRETVTAVEPRGELWRALAEPRGRYRFCANAEHHTCNWLIDSRKPDPYCEACRHNRTIPDLSNPESEARWRKIEIAKHRLFYTVLKLRLPLTTRTENPEDGLAFDFLSPDSPIPGHPAPPVMTGHANGVITLSLAEADDVERERQRTQMGETYRTVLGHFRHEIAHYYWDQLIANSQAIEEFRKIFGDEREDYGAALERHYANGAPADWPDRYVTAYASSHPWEDFAETWAHYFHMVDTLETARAFGLSVRPRVTKGAALATTIDFDPHNSSMERIIESWLPLTFAINSINRSMGLSDLYPFVLSPPVIVKLTFLHDRIHSRSRRPHPNTGLKAIVARLRQNIGTPG